MAEFDFCEIRGVHVAATSPQAVTEEAFARAERGERGFVVVSATHLFVESQDDPALLAGINQSMAVVPDGRPLFWLLRLLGRKHAQHVRGHGLTLRVLDHANRHRRSVGIYGGRPEMLALLVALIKKDYPNLTLSYAQPGSFAEQSDADMAAIAADVNAAAPDVLFVGLGCPRQEKWMIRQQHQIQAVMIGVGGALDLVAGEIKAAPRWMQVAGLEWFHRFIKEPRRLWRRYLVCNSRFIAYAVLALLRRR
jgi:N-acetylglucosaminyldiphosphoundecaprenol N-acetyl-beta-D-mannosaminyltransferase